MTSVRVVTPTRSRLVTPVAELLAVSCECLVPAEGEELTIVVLPLKREDVLPAMSSWIVSSKVVQCKC